jgi:hypothetical protein
VQHLAPESSIGWILDGPKLGDVMISSSPRPHTERGKASKLLSDVPIRLHDPPIINTFLQLDPRNGRKKYGLVAYLVLSCTRSLIDPSAMMVLVKVSSSLETVDVFLPSTSRNLYTT